MKLKLSYARALPLASKLVEALSPACERIEIAGSIRRHTPTVGDIELVAIPRYRVDLPPQLSLFNDEKPKYVSALDCKIERLLEAKPPLTRLKNGDLYKQFSTEIDEDGTGVGIDLFLTTAEQWGYIMALRTGPADFGRAWVTQQNKGGLLPDEFRFEGGWLYRGAERIETPDERALFDTIGLLFLEPEDRHNWRKYSMKLAY